MKIKVLIVNNYVLFPDGMRYLLQQLTDEVEVIKAGIFPEEMEQADNNPEINLALPGLNMPDSNRARSINEFQLRNCGMPLVLNSDINQGGGRGKMHAAYPIAGTEIQ